MISFPALDMARRMTGGSWGALLLLIEAAAAEPVLRHAGTAEDGERGRFTSWTVSSDARPVSLVRRFGPSPSVS